ncbi:phthiocerol/phthiodiolone dimycocerosyl transferase family protein [Nocardia sp. IFM 10818]
MDTHRLLSPFEIAYFGGAARLTGVPKSEVPLFIGTTVRGEVDIDILRLVLDELAAGHALLRAVLVDDPGGAPRFELRADHRPTLEVTEGGDDAYRRLINSEPDWSAGFFAARVLRDGDRTQIVLIVHHGMSDGRSMFALVDEMWQRYSAHLAGSPLPLFDGDRALIDGADAQLMRTVTDAEVDAFIAQLNAIALAPESAAAAPRQVVRDGEGNGDPLGRFAVRRIELTAAETADLVTLARAQGFSVSSLITGAALMAVRPHLDAGAGPVPMLAGHAVDVRSYLVPPVPTTTVLCCVAGVATPVVASADSDPIELAKMVDAGMRAALELKFPALYMAATQRDLDAVTAALFASPPTLGMSNVGRLHAHSLPEGLEFVRDDMFAMAKGMAPKMTIFTIDDRLTIQVEYDTATNSDAQMMQVTEAMREQVAGRTRLPR